MLKKLTSLAISGVLATTMGTTAACGDRAKLETCKIIEIEEAEFEVEFGDVDAEGGEVEMVCGDKIVDVPWRQFRQKLRINPEQYLAKEAQFAQQVTCTRDERSRKKEVFCQGPNSAGEFVVLNFDYDD